MDVLHMSEATMGASVKGVEDTVVLYPSVGTSGEAGLSPTVGRDVRVGALPPLKIPDVQVPIVEGEVESPQAQSTRRCTLSGDSQ